MIIIKYEFGFNITALHCTALWKWC